MNLENMNLVKIILPIIVIGIMVIYVIKNPLSNQKKELRQMKILI